VGGQASASNNHSTSTSHFPRDACPHSATDTGRGSFVTHKRRACPNHPPHHTESKSEALFPTAVASANRLLSRMLYHLPRRLRDHRFHHYFGHCSCSWATSPHSDSSLLTSPKHHSHCGGAHEAIFRCEVAEVTQQLEQLQGRTQTKLHCAQQTKERRCRARSACTCRPSSAGIRGTQSLRTSPLRQSEWPTMRPHNLHLGKPYRRVKKITLSSAESL
jgi:hypothetical protein